MQLVKSTLLLFFFLIGQSLIAQDDGPRVYWNAPTGTNVIESYAWFTQSNSLNGNSALFDPDITANALTVLFNYNRFYNFAGRSAIFTASLPFGNATADIDEGVTQSTRGIADVYLQTVVNLIGAPALSLEDFETYEQKTLLFVLLGVSAPIGNYNSSKLLNMGENRWGLRFGLPFVQKIGDWVPGKLTTLEITPSVWIFTDNDEFVGNSTLEQDTFFMLEAHLTRDITEQLFASLDFLHQSGGETTIDGMSQDDATSASFLGLSLGYMLNPQFQFKFRYNASLNPDQENDIDMDTLQLNFSYFW